MKKWMKVTLTVLVACLIIGGIFVGASFLGKSASYRVYKLFDHNTVPETLTYDLVTVKSNASVKEKVQVIISKLQEETLTTAVPPNAGIISVSVSEYNPLPEGLEEGAKYVTINFDDKFTEDFPTGSFGERMMVDTITNSVTEIEGIYGVQFYLNGEELDLSSSHFIYNEPAERNIDSYIVRSGDPKEFLESFLFTDETKILRYEGGPSHYGSRDIVVKEKTANGYTYTVTDQSDLRGEEPNAVWEEKWEIKDDGLYIDGLKILNADFKVEEDEWRIENYKDGNYAIARVMKAGVIDGAYEVKVNIAVPDIKSPDGRRAYRELITLRQGSGLKEKEIREMSMDEDFWLRYFLDRIENL